MRVSATFWTCQGAWNDQSLTNIPESTAWRTPTYINVFWLQSLKMIKVNLDSIKRLLLVLGPHLGNHCLHRQLCDFIDNSGEKTSTGCLLSSLECSRYARGMSSEEIKNVSRWARSLHNSLIWTLSHHLKTFMGRLLEEGGGGTGGGGGGGWGFSPGPP